MKNNVEQLKAAPDEPQAGDVRPPWARYGDNEPDNPRPLPDEDTKATGFERVFRVCWYGYRGHSYVLAKDYDEAVKKAHAGQDVDFEEADNYDSNPEVDREDCTDEFEPEDIEEMKKEERA